MNKLISNRVAYTIIGLALALPFVGFAIFIHVFADDTPVFIIDDQMGNNLFYATNSYLRAMVPVTDASGSFYLDSANNLSELTNTSTARTNLGLAIVSRVQASSTRTLNSAFQISTTRDALATYSVQIATTISLTTGETGTVFLEISPTSTFATGVQELGRFVNGNSGTLTLGLNLTQTMAEPLMGYVPSGYWVRLRTANTVGTPTFTYQSGQETIL